MYLTAQRVLSASGENGINGFLYLHGDVVWTVPPEPTNGAFGELVHTFITVLPGGNKVLSYVDIVAPDGTVFDGHLRERICVWMADQARARRPLPWIGIVEDMRIGLHMTATYAKTWTEEVTKLLTACQLTWNRVPPEAWSPASELPASELPSSELPSSELPASEESEEPKS